MLLKADNDLNDMLADMGSVLMGLEPRLIQSGWSALAGLTGEICWHCTGKAAWGEAIVGLMSISLGSGN